MVHQQWDTERWDRLTTSVHKRQSDLSLCIPVFNKEHNASAVIRCAEIFAVKKVYIIGKRIRFNSAAKGSYKWINIEYVPTYKIFFDSFRSVSPIVVADVRGSQSLYSFQWPKRSILVLGHEGGVIDIIHKNADYTLKIPQYGVSDSLNVSVAAGIFLFHHRQQFDISL